MQRNKWQPSFKGRFKMKRRREDEKRDFICRSMLDDGSPADRMRRDCRGRCGGQQDKAASTYPEPLAQEQYERLFA